MKDSWWVRKVYDSKTSGELISLAELFNKQDAALLRANISNVEGVEKIKGEYIIIVASDERLKNLNIGFYVDEDLELKTEGVSKHNPLSIRSMILNLFQFWRKRFKRSNSGRPSNSPA